MLYNNGYKISKIGRLSEADIPIVVKEIVAKNNVENHTINAFKLAVINFDQPLFLSTYNRLSLKKSFREIFIEVFVPLLNELGLLWQTNTICPAHQHFISNLIIQKIHANTEKIQHIQPTKTDKVFIPFLPENEIHEIGLLFMNYEIVSHGYKSIYLGQTTPMKNLIGLMNCYDNIHFISYFTVAPTKDCVLKYVKEFHKMAMENNHNSKLWILGRQNQYLDNDKLPNNIRGFQSLQKLVEELNLQSS